MTIPRPRVLVVEDIPTLRRAYACVLERHGYEVSVARNGGAALVMLDEFLSGPALHCGAAEFLAQPISPQALVDAVGRLAGRVRPSLAGRRDSA